ncbi:MAG: von Willebrand factor type, partial [Actinomycetia bacterium]|nr:von Willebrand factor type [Actinomycetes bacterium]
GLRDLLRQARDRRRELRERGRLDGTLERVRELLDQAVEAERQALFPDPSDAARLAEAELDQLPPDTARAVRQRADYPWRAPAAAATYEQIRDLLRREVLDSQFRGMRDALAGASPEELQRIRDMVADLNAMLEADARGEDTQRQFEEFMERYGDMFPENPRSLEELVDALARRAAAASRLAASLTPEQRAELAALSQSVLGDLGLQYELDRLGRSLRSRRPDLSWDQGAAMGGEQPLGLGDATTALEELADLESLEASLGQRYPGASLDDIDLEAVERALGRAAVDDVETLRRLERELTEQGYLVREQGELKLSPKAIRRIGAVALRRVFSSLDEGRRGDHDVPGLGLAGEPTGASRPWVFGDEEPLDVVRTVRNAVLRGGAVDSRGHPASRSATVPLRGGEAREAGFQRARGAEAPGAGLARARRAGRAAAAVALSPEDFEVLETERRTSAAVCLLVDQSYSMLLRETWGMAKATALALHSLVSTRYPQDALEVIGFSLLARTVRPAELPDLDAAVGQGTNLHHALVLAGRHLDRHPEAEPVVLVVTDGEPTAHLEPDGYPIFDYPPDPRTIELTLTEVTRLTRRRATINTFMLDDDPRLVAFVDLIARLNGGRVFAPSPDRLGDYVVSDYLRARRGRRGR